MNMTSSGLQYEVAYWPAMTLGGAAQVAEHIARTNGLWTPQSEAITDPPMPQPAALWPPPLNVLRQRLAIDYPLLWEGTQTTLLQPAGARFFEINASDPNPLTRLLIWIFSKLMSYIIYILFIERCKTVVLHSIFTARCYADCGYTTVCRLSVRPSVCDVQVPWSHRLEFLENNFTAE